MRKIFESTRQDLPASIVVFLVAIPLCLGIALASGAPLFSGIIAGIVGGIVVGIASGSPLGVSGPAAGLTVIVATAITTLNGSWEAFLLAVVLAGVIQLIAGYARAGIIAYYFPSSVIKGMLTGIGLIIILKQIPHAVGYDGDFEGDMAFKQADGENTFSEIINMINYISPGVVLITVISMAILILWEQVLSKKHKIFMIIQGPLVVVLTGILMNYLYASGVFDFKLGENQVVKIPVAGSVGEFIGQFRTPDFSQLSNPDVYITALVIAIIASLETLLCVEATDKLDPYKRITPTNRELKAQGLGNIVSGLIGGLPVTQVIVRSSTNITFGGKTKMSTIYHGTLLLISAIAIPHVLNLIPLASLAAILFMVGYKLAKPALFRQMYKLGGEQFVPFVVTVAAILLTDLLKGIGIGMVVAIFYILRHNYRNPFYVAHHEANGEFHIQLAEDVTFINKGSVMQMLENIPENSNVIIDGKNSKSIDYDVLEMIQDFESSAANKNITVRTVGLEQHQNKS